MAILATAQFLRNVGINTAKYDEIAHMAVEEMKNGGFADDCKREISEYVSLSGKKLNIPFGRISCPGHIYEAAWFVLCEGEVKNDDEIRNFGRKLVDYAMPDGFETITDLIPTLRQLDKPLEECRGDEYLQWPQQEAVIAYRLAYNIFGDERYLKLSQRIEKMMFSYFEIFDDSLWFVGMRKSNGELCTPKGKCMHISGPFHFERMLLALGSIEKTGSILEYMK